MLVMNLIGLLDERYGMVYFRSVEMKISISLFFFDLADVF